MVQRTQAVNGLQPVDSRFHPMPMYKTSPEWKMNIDNKTMVVLLATNGLSVSSLYNPLFTASSSCAILGTHNCTNLSRTRRGDLRVWRGCEIIDEFGRDFLMPEARWSTVVSLFVVGVFSSPAVSCAVESSVSVVSSASLALVGSAIFAPSTAMPSFAPPVPIEDAGPVAKIV